MDILGMMIFGMMEGIADNPFFFVLGACIVAITACVVVKMRVVDIRWVIVGVLGLAALALLAFAPAFVGSMVLIAVLYRFSMSTLVPWLRRAHQAHHHQPYQARQAAKDVVDEWVRPVRQPEPEPKPEPEPPQAPCGRELVVYGGASSPKAGQISPWAIWGVAGLMVVACRRPLGRHRRDGAPLQS
jgi:hypothetical protein